MRTCVVAIARLEGRYLKEWVEHYKSLGFDNIFLCDNDHDGDEEDLSAILKPYEGFVKVLDYRNKVGYQMKAYSEVYELLKEDYDWILFCDVDEFLEVKQNNVSEYLKDKSDFDCIMINWLCFGDCENIHYEDKPIQERFKYPLPIDLKVQYNFPENFHIKSFIKGGLKEAHFGGNPHCTDSKLKCCNASGVQVENRPWQLIDYSQAYLKHYITKSLEEYYLNKMKRGTGDRPYESFLRFYKDRYFRYNKMTEGKLQWLKEHNFA